MTGLVRPIISHPMNVPEFRPEFLQIAMADHDIISRYIDNAGKLFLGDSAEASAEPLEALEYLISNKLVDHFAYEDANIFPALLAGQPSDQVADRVRALQKEHPILLEKARTLARALFEYGHTRRHIGAVHDATIDLFGLLSEHAEHENALFLSLLDQHRLSL